MKQFSLNGINDLGFVLGINEKLIDAVTELPNFLDYPASLNNKHHHWPGGLAEHTWEVIHLMNGVNAGLGNPCDPVELFLSGLYHDVGKLYDYENFPQYPGNINYVAAPHKKKIHHITRSVMIFTKAATSLICPEMEDAVIHNILSHHGSPQWGSPISPQTKAAWMLHLCDGLSARMEDGDRIQRN